MKYTRVNIGNGLCRTCGIAFTKKSHNQSFCCHECRSSFLSGKRMSTIGVGRKNAGSYAEIIACADLLRKGYDVFRSVSDHASCDIIAVKDNHIVRVEVRSAVMDNNHNPAFPKKHEDKTRSDIYAAVVIDDNGSPNVFYIPIVKGTIV